MQGLSTDKREYQNYKANNIATFCKIEGTSCKQIWVCPKSFLFYIFSRNEFFLNFATKELVKIPILFPHAQLVAMQLRWVCQLVSYLVRDEWYNVLMSLTSWVQKKTTVFTNHINHSSIIPFFLWYFSHHTGRKVPYS